MTKSYYETLSSENQDIVSTLPVLMQGSEGIYVKVLQTLIVVNLNFEFDIDGEYGYLTKNAVRVWQEYSGLGPTGIVDKETWSSFFAK